MSNTDAGISLVAYGGEPMVSKRIVQGVGVVGLGIVLAACGGSSATSRPPSPVSGGVTSFSIEKWKLETDPLSKTLTDNVPEYYYAICEVVGTDGALVSRDRCDMLAKRPSQLPAGSFNLRVHVPCYAPTETPISAGAEVVEIPLPERKPESAYVTETIGAGSYPGTLAYAGYWAPGFDSRVRENSALTKLMLLPDPDALAVLKTKSISYPPNDRIFEIPCTHVVARIDDAGKNWDAGDLVVLPSASLTAEKPSGSAGDGDKAEAAQLAELADREVASGQCLASRSENLGGLVEPVRKWMFDNVTVQSKTDLLHLDDHQFAVATKNGTKIDLGVAGPGDIHIFVAGYGPVVLETKEKASKSPWEVVFKQHNANHTDSLEFKKTSKGKTTVTVKGNGCVLLMAFRLIEGKR